MSTLLATLSIKSLFQLPQIYYVSWKEQSKANISKANIHKTVSYILNIFLDHNLSQVPDNGKRIRAFRGGARVEPGCLPLGL